MVALPFWRVFYKFLRTVIQYPRPDGELDRSYSDIVTPLVSFGNLFGLLPRQYVSLALIF